MNAITLWCSLWNAATYEERDALFATACRVFGAAVVFAAVAVLTDAETDAADPAGPMLAVVDEDGQADIWRAYGGGAF
jgi:hypothetical protein